jgi:hypothetical protein
MAGSVRTKRSGSMGRISPANWGMSSATNAPNCVSGHQPELQTVKTTIYPPKA